MPTVLLLVAVAAATLLASLSVDLDTLVLTLVLFSAAAALASSDGKKAETAARCTGHPLDRRNQRAQACSDAPPRSGSSHAALEFSRF